MQDIAHPRTKRWAELADIRYALLLGFLEHYLLTSSEDRSTLIGWCFAEMRSRIGLIARELTTMPLRGARDSSAAAIAFTLPAGLHLPEEEAARWSIHQERTTAAIAKVEEMRGADAADERNPYLTDLLASDQARLALIEDPTTPPPTATSFARDILPLFRQKDVEHMRSFGVELGTYDGARAKAEMILVRVQGSGPPMPPAPDQRWTKPQVDLVERWIADGFPQ